MAEVLAKAKKYINGEEALISKKESSSTHKEKSRTDKQQGRSLKRQRNRERSPKKDRERSPKRRGSVRDRLGSPQPELRQRYSPRQFTPLKAVVSQVLREVQHEQFLRWPSQMRSDPTKRDNTRYCEFHRDHGHRTDDCIQLRKEIEYLIRRGYLRRFVVSESQTNGARTRKKVKSFNTKGGGGGGTILTVRGCSQKKLKELEEVSAKVEKSSLS